MTNYKLLAPGPVPIPLEVRKILEEPPLHHRTPEFEKTLSRVKSGMAQVYGTKQPVIFHTSCGSGAMESAIVNLIEPGDQVLCIIGGKFAERWKEIAEIYGATTITMNLPWGESLDLTKFEALLKQHGSKLKAVLTQACETSSATVFPIEKMSAIIKKHSEALFMVDAITALGCMNMPMDQWGLDVVVAGSQKALMLPTGLSFIALSEKAWQLQKKNKTPKFYFDLEREKKALEKNQTYFSSAVHHLRALDVVLSLVEKKGWSALQKRCETLMNATHEFIRLMGLELFSKSPSPSVTAILLPSTIKGEKLRDWIESEKKITVMGGQDQYKDKILRIGHMGDIHDEDMIELFSAIAEALDHFSAGTDFKNKWQKAKPEVEKKLKASSRIFA